MWKWLDGTSITKESLRRSGCRQYRAACGLNDALGFYRAKARGYGKENTVNDQI